MSAAKGARLWARWSKRERDLLFSWDAMQSGSAHGHLLHGFFDIVQSSNGKSLVEELEARGFDITTLRFSIRKKVSP